MEGRSTSRGLLSKLDVVWKAPLAFVFSLSESMGDGAREPKPPRYSKEEAEEILEAEMTGDAQVSAEEHARLKRIAGYK